MLNKNKLVIEITSTHLRNNILPFDNLAGYLLSTVNIPHSFKPYDCLA